MQNLGHTQRSTLWSP